MRAANDFDPSSVDLDAFLKDVLALGEELKADLGPEDLAQLRTVERRGRLATALGLATCWLVPNPLSAAALSFGRSTRWLLMHHVGHRGYDRVPGTPARLTSKHFAKGWRRFLDWADWIEPEAWKYEHNVLHHSHTGEEADPDLVERNTAWLREHLPMTGRYVALAILALTWRASYYTQATARVLREQQKTLKPDLKQLPEGLQLVLESYAPYFLFEFVLFPLLFLPLGPWAAFSAGANSLMAEFLTNLHTFLVVGPNHSGDDLYRFEDAPKDKAERYLRQIIGSVNYRTGGDWNDHLHLFLNYQIEHHLWPDAPMLQYQKLQPKVRALCEKHGIPYVQESVWTRARKLTEVFVGKAAMRVVPRRTALKRAG
ncbi:MAG: fatty acid desaturase [Myxococcaceae bacterium]|nr:fatty acid desaturase [Myxococcaceae bacterium]